MASQKSENSVTMDIYTQPLQAQNEAMIAKEIMSEKKQLKRYLLPDVLRGLAVWLMIGGHFYYDLFVIGWLSIGIKQKILLIAWQKITVFIFLVNVGICLREAYIIKINWGKFSERLLKLGLVTLAISIVTYVAYPTQWIYFGILHNIFFSSILGLLFIRTPKISLWLGLVILFLYYIVDWHGVPILHLLNISNKTMDYQPLYPLFSYVLIGIYLHFINFHKYYIPEGRITNLLRFTGKHALLVYLLHQPLLIGILIVIKQAFSIW